MGLRGNILAVIPALNEARTIGRIILRVKRYVDSVIVVDGHSSDGTKEVAMKAGANVLTQLGKGKGEALRQAFRLANGDIVVFMDADGSMRPEEIPRILKVFEENPNVDVVKGSRFMKGGCSEDITILRKIGNLFFVFLVNLFWSANYTDICYGFGAFRKSALDKVLPYLKADHFEIETEIFIKVQKLGLNVLEVPSVELKRTDGKSHLNTFRDGFRILKTIIKELVQRK